MKKAPTGRLSLNRESLRRLQSQEIEKAQGAALTPNCTLQSCHWTCVSCFGTCTC